MPACSQAKSRPVRPKPVATSSAMNRAPWRCASSWSAWRYAGGCIHIPAAPCTSGSTMTAASSGPCAANVARASASDAASAPSASIPRDHRNTCGGVRRTAGTMASATKRWNVSEKPTPTAPSVSPW